MSSWLAAWPASRFSRMERGVLGGDVSQRIVALSSWVACGTKPHLEAHLKMNNTISLSFCVLPQDNIHLL